MSFLKEVAICVVLYMLIAFLFIYGIIVIINTIPEDDTNITKQTEVARIVPAESTNNMIYHIRPNKPIRPIEPIKEEVTIVTETIETITATEPERWWTDEELDILAAVIYYEAGSNDCSDRHQQLVAQVVLNRVASNEFPNNIYDVVTQQNPTQYSTYKLVLRNMGNRDIIPQRCYNNALKALNGKVDCPDNVVWQANFIQGSEIYEIHETSYSVTYFCYR